MLWVLEACHLISDDLTHEGQIFESSSHKNKVSFTHAKLSVLLKDDYLQMDEIFLKINVLSICVKL